jgi:Beta-lactamase enzyme family
MRRGRRRRRGARVRGLPLLAWGAVASSSLVLLVVVLLVVSGAGGGRGPGSDGGATSRAAGKDVGRLSRRGKSASPRASAAFSATPAADKVLASALAPLLAHLAGTLSVGILDRTTGTAAVYNGGRLFDTASIVKVDILATLLLEHQRNGTALSAEDQQLATEMIEESDDVAASHLWHDVGGASAIAAANVTLGLRDTAPGKDGFWGLTTTDVTDQLALLYDLTSSASPLDAASRSYELGLMENVEADQAWGVTAAATPGTVPAVKNGWLPLSSDGLWVINSIGVIHHSGQRILVAVLSDNQPSEFVAINQVESAAEEAVSAITADRSLRGLRAGADRSRIVEQA